MNKTQLIRAIAADAGITQAQAEKALISLLRNIKRSLERGERVSLVGFGSWSVLQRAARAGRNPATGMRIQIPSKKIVKFKAGAGLSNFFGDVNIPETKLLIATKDSGFKGANISSSGDTSVVKRTESATDFSPKAQGPPEAINFSIMVPKSISKGSMFILDLWAFLESERNKVKELAKELGRDRTLGQKVGVVVTKDSLISAKLVLPNFTIANPIEFIHWQGATTNSSFIITTPDALKSRDNAGFVVLSCEGLAIGKIPFVLSITAEAAKEVVPLETKTEYYKTAFASYASKNRAEVLSRIQGMKKIAPQLDVFVDALSLRSGDDWEKKLKEYVPTKDVFFLFWSKAASSSSWVKNEWEMALRERGIEYISPVPLDEPDIAPPPEELSKLHFNDAYLAHIKYLELKNA